jgi:hypothetical protein
MSTYDAESILKASGKNGKIPASIPTNIEKKNDFNIEDDIVTEFFVSFVKELVS